TRQWSEAVAGLAASGGTVVAVGRATYRDPARTEGRTWFSTGSLQQWNEGIVNGNITSIDGGAAEAHGFVAVAAQGDEPAGLRATDGRPWDEIARVRRNADPTDTNTGDTAPVFDGDLATAIVVLNDRFLVTTTSGALWSSPSGADWTKVDVRGDPPRGPL